MRTLCEALLDRLAGRPTEAVAEDGAARLTAGDLLDLSAHQAEALDAIGLGQGEPVLLACSNRAADLAGFLGIWRQGGVAVPVHRRIPEPQYRRLLAATGARAVLNPCPDLPTALPAQPLAVLGDPPPARPLLSGAAEVIFTSGSTGEPKGVVIGHKGLAAKLAAIGAALPMEPAPRTLLVLQLTFIFGQWVSFLTLLNGGRVLLRDRFDAAAVLGDLAAHGIDHLAVVPTMLRALLPLAQAHPAYAGALMTGGEILPPALAQGVAAAWPRARLWDFYGLTETCACDFMAAPGDYPDAAGSIGRPMDGIDCRIESETGELQIRSPYRMLGYFDRPELTAAAFDGDWFRTGDRAERRADGRIAITGRLKDLIIRGGNKVAPVEIERAAEAHAEIAAALAAGVPDAALGEAVHLFVVRRDGAGLSEDALRTWLAGRLERFKLPDRIHFGASLPTGATGKADRAALRRLAGG